MVTENRFRRLRRVFLRLLLISRYTWRYWAEVLLAMFLALLAAFTQVVSLLVMAGALEATLSMVGATSATQIAEAPPAAGGFLDLANIGAFVAAWIQNNLFTAFGDINLIAAYVVTLFVLVLLSTSSETLTEWLAYRVRLKCIFDLQRDVFSHALHLPLSFFQKGSVGDTTSRIKDDVKVTAGPVYPILNTMITQPIVLVVYGYLMLRTSVTLSTIVAGAGIAILVIAGIAGSRLKGFAAKERTKVGLVYAIIQESFGAARLIKTFGTEEFETDRFWQRTRQEYEITPKVYLASTIIRPISKMLSLVVVIIVLLSGLQLVQNETLTVQALLVFLYVAQASARPMSSLAGGITQLYGVVGASRRVMNLLEQYSENDTDGQPIKDFKTNLELRHVSFDYGEGVVLKNVSIEIKRGEIVALVGPSGAGKSTVVDLLMRFHLPQQGEVLVDGENVNNTNLKQYRALFGVVSQDVILLNQSVISNIAYGVQKLDEDIYDRVVRAAKLANAHDFITEMPNGYDTVLGERGVRLSGGQRQRIAIARAIFRDPKVLIFDEATSSLDSIAESQVQEAMDRAVCNRTSIVIAHRLSTVQKADKIVVMDDGRVIDCGTHLELLLNCPLYRELYKAQFQT